MATKVLKVNQNTIKERPEWSDPPLSSGADEFPEPTEDIMIAVKTGVSKHRLSRVLDELQKLVVQLPQQ